jgi:hypothetical protein
MCVTDESANNARTCLLSRCADFWAGLLVLLVRAVARTVGLSTEIFGKAGLLDGEVCCFCDKLDVEYAVAEDHEFSFVECDNGCPAIFVGGAR